MKRYLLQHRVAYLSQPDVKAPQLIVAPDPLFQWEQTRTSLGAMTLVFAITVGEDGKPRDISIVTPVGMGLDDDAAQALTGWQFKPARCNDRPCAVPARVIFDIAPTNTRPMLP